VRRTTEDGDDRDEYPCQASPQGAGKAENPAAARPANGPASSGGERSDTQRSTSRRRRGTDIEAEVIERELRGRIEPGNENSPGNNGGTVR
jgi:hypothetical protein